jgi:hypothetical protein
MKVTITNDGQYPVKVMQRVNFGHPVNEEHSESTEFSEVFIQPGDSLQVEGWYKAVEMDPLVPTVDPAMYSGD